MNYEKIGTSVLASTLLGNLLLSVQTAEFGVRPYHPSMQTGKIGSGGFVSRYGRTVKGCEICLKWVSRVASGEFQMCFSVGLKTGTTFHFQTTLLDEL